MKGEDISSVSCERYGSSSDAKVVAAGKSGPGEKTAAVLSSVSKSSIWLKAAGLSHGGGCMFARRCLFRSNASHSGKGVGNGGFSACVGPYANHQRMDI